MSAGVCADPARARSRRARGSTRADAGIAGALLRGGLALGIALCWLARPGPVAAGGIPPWLPRYDLDIHLQVHDHRVVVHERVTWTNPCSRPTDRVVFNVASHYSIPDKDIGFLAKMLEILRLAPSEALDFDGPACTMERAQLTTPPPSWAGTPASLDLPFAFRPDNATALEVVLPAPVGPGESVTLELFFTVRLPQKQGRWGQWKDTTFLAQWLPVAAFYGADGWDPPPFIPWHQPFFNEAGWYKAQITLPAEQHLASTGSVIAVHDLGNGWKRVDLAPICTRDFAVFCSSRFFEYTGEAGPVHVRVLAYPEHEFYAREMVRIACEAIPTYSEWFGPFPYPEFTIVQSFFGWNGNECGDLVMIDQRIFNMPHLACAFVDHLVSHEICHQWWYNVVGTNGYCETWMDEGLATYFAHRRMDGKYGKNNELLALPRGLRWLPNIHREDYRHYGMLGTIGRGELTPTIQEMPKFSHLPNLSSMCYDRGSKIVGMIEARLGDNMLPFMKQVYHKYYFRILRVADFQRELELFTGTSWQEFFQGWLYGTDGTDWCLENVHIEPLDRDGPRLGRRLAALLHVPCREPRPCKATVLIRQKGKCNEPTCLGFRLEQGDGFQVRVPILPNPGSVPIDDGTVHVEVGVDGWVRVEVLLPSEPLQIAIDPDHVLLDSNPCNNAWKPEVRIRGTPVYSQLEETDLTNSYDRWNVIFGPWIFGPSWRDPWYTRSTMVGLRAAAYRTQEAVVGSYLAYRTDDRNLVVGVDGLLDHWPYCKTQVGFNLERSIATLSDSYPPLSRGVLFGRYVFMYGDSLYLPPFHYVEMFTGGSANSLPYPAHTEPGAERIGSQALIGVHHHLNLLTPYWDAEGGLLMDLTYQDGLPLFGEHQESHQIFGQISTVKSMPGWLGFCKDVPGLGWLMDTRWAFRLWGAAAAPNRGQFFTLGGGDQFRGFDLRERQGSQGWIGSVEWRVPLVKGVEWDCCDHVAGMRNAYAALFYDAGDMFVAGHSQGPVAHALGAGLRLDVAWFSLIERTILRVDVAKTINADTPVQFWFGVQHPF
jgi:hypothetical protein